MLPHPRVKRLGIQFNSQGWPSVATASDLTPLVQSFFTKVPKIERVYIYGHVSEALDPTIVSSLSCLRSLSLHRLEFVGRQDHRRYHIQSSSITYINMDGEIGMLHSLSSNSATGFSFRFRDREATHDDELHRSITMISDEHWKSLTHLGITGSYYDSPLQFVHLQLSKLCSLSITHISMAATIYYRLAQRPNELPALRELNSCIIPEWDIFVIMLQRRMRAQNEGVLQLQSMRFSTGLPRHIHNLLIRHMKGYLVKWPNYHELSIYTSIESVLDLSISGCMACHLNRVYCSSPVIPADKEKGRVSLLQASIMSLDPYPTSVDEILATWEIRFSKMHSLLWISKLRRKECFCASLEITQDTPLLEDDSDRYLDMY